MTNATNFMNNNNLRRHILTEDTEIIMMFTSMRGEENSSIDDLIEGKYNEFDLILFERIFNKLHIVICD